MSEAVDGGGCTRCDDSSATQILPCNQVAFPHLDHGYLSMSKKLIRLRSEVLADASLLLRGVKKNWIRRAAHILCLAAAAVFSQLSAAQAEYPDGPIRLVVPFGPGGAADVSARILAQKLNQKLGQQVVVENMPGPGGINAARTVVRAPANGYTIGLLSNGTAISVDMFKHLPFDPVNQFAMVSQIGSFDLLIAVDAHSKYKTLQDLIASAKANPGKLNIGTIAAGSTQNLGAELFRSMTETNMIIVPYKSSPEIIVALLQGDLAAMLDFPPAVEGQMEAGKLRILASSGARRSPFLKDVPTVAESGVPNYEVSSWIGIFAPKSTPKAIISILNSAIAEIVAMPDVKEKFAKVGVIAESSTPDELMARLKRDIKKWKAVIQKAGIPQK